MYIQIQSFLDDSDKEHSICLFLYRTEAIIDDHILTSRYLLIQYMFKVNYENARKRREVCSKLIRKTPKRYHWGHAFIVNFKRISHSGVSTFDFAKINTGRAVTDGMRL